MDIVVSLYILSHWQMERCEMGRLARVVCVGRDGYLAKFSSSRGEHSSGKEQSSM